MPGDELQRDRAEHAEEEAADEAQAESESDDSEDDSNTAEEVAATAGREGRPLLEGSSISLFGGELPHRTLLAIGVFVVVFMLVWVALWGLVGGWGLGLGWIIAAAVGALAVWLLTRSLWADSRRSGAST